MNKKISKGRWATSFKTGKQAEKVFSELMAKKGLEVVKSNRNDDIHKHIDFYVDGVGFDVKGNRHLDCIWLEIQNVRGKDGWLKGKAKFIAFDIKELNCFCFYRRTDLLKYVMQFKETTTYKTDYLKWYSRSKWGRDDKIIKVKHEHIKHLEIKQLPYATT